MVISAIIRFFPRFGDLEALEKILEGLAIHDGTESTRFPAFIRPSLRAMKWEIERSFNSKCSFLVDRVKTDILELLEQHTNEEADTTLSGIYHSSKYISELFAERK
jgi:hypothetical protein